MDLFIRIMYHAGVAILSLIALYLVIKGLEAKRAKAILKMYNKEDILAMSSNVNYFGKYSKRFKQVRGNGVLVLTKDELFFQLWLPKNTIKIPVSNITGVGETRVHNGKTIGFKLLKVHFVSQEDGSTDSCAWYVRNRDLWEEKIKELIQK